MEKSIFTVNLPDIGEGVVEGEVIEWLKKVGDSLKQDEPVVVVMTDKATVELPAPHPGILAKQYYQPGQISIRDQPLYDIELNTEISSETASKHIPHTPSADSGIKSRLPLQEKATNPRATPPRTGIAIPKVRHLAKELGVDISRISGSGKEGRIVAQDLIPCSTDPSKKNVTCSHLDDSEHTPLLGVRGMMAKKMAQAAEIPMFSYFEQAEATRLIQIKHNVKKQAVQEGINLSYMPFFIRALSLCAKKYPLLLSSLDMESKQLIVHKHHHIGIAIASEQGLIVPVLKDVQNMKFEDVVRAYEELKKKAMANKLDPSDMRGATITISNFGALLGDGLWATPVINAPEVAILAVGHMKPQPVVRNDQVVVRDMISFSWSFDHRVLDGAQAAAISHFFCSLIRDPASLL